MGNFACDVTALRDMGVFRWFEVQSYETRVMSVVGENNALREQIKNKKNFAPMSFAGESRACARCRLRGSRGRKFVCR